MLRLRQFKICARKYTSIHLHFYTFICRHTHTHTHLGKFVKYNGIHYSDTRTYTHKCAYIRQGQAGMVRQGQAGMVRGKGAWAQPQRA